MRQHIADGGDEAEIVFHPGKIAALVRDYSIMLEAYRKDHGIEDLIDGDKIAAFTGILIMRHRPITSETGEVNTIFAALANETFAIRTAELFLRHKKFNFTPATHKQLLYCFAKSHMCDTSVLHRWVVATMSQLLGHGSVKDPMISD